MVRETRRSLRLKPIALMFGCIMTTGSGAIQAAVTSATSGLLQFNSGPTSIYGSGGTAAFGGSGYLLGNATTGVAYRASANSGTMTSAVSGRLKSTYDNEVLLADAGNYGFGLDWLGSSSRFTSDMGANIRFSGELLGVINNFTIYAKDYGLNINKSFTSTTPQTVTGADDFTPASVSVGLPTGGIGLSGSAGVDFDIQQDATFKIQRVVGTVVANHVDSGASVSKAFAIDTTGLETINGLNLGAAGVWDVNFEDVTLVGTFESVFSMEANPFIGGGWGIFCGDPFDADDNFGCVSEGGVKTARAIGVNLFTSPLLNLDYNEIGSLDAFQVTVVPLPAALPLLVSAIGLVGWLGRPSRRGAARSQPA